MTVEADGTGERVVGPGHSPRWSRDGSRLAFYRELGELRGAIVVAEDGAGERAIFEGAVQGPPSWSPTGDRIAFTVAFDQTYVASADGRTVRALRRGGAWQAPNWSPNGSKILVSSGITGIYALDVDGGGETRLTTGDDQAPAWSPDGTRVAFERGRYNEKSDGIENTRVWVMNADGTGARRLTRAQAAESSPQWSPQGDQIVFGRGELYAIAPDGSGARQLTKTTPTEARSTAELRNPAGQLLRTLTAQGRVEAIALSRSRVALLVAGFFGKRLALFEARTGASRGSLPVPMATAPELSVAGTTVVFRVRNTIYVADGRRLTSRVVARARSAPIGLSIEGRRIAWAETDGNFTRNVRYRGRIRAIVLPRD